MVIFDEYVEKIVKGTTTLSLGCAAGEQFWKLEGVANEIYGLDIDREFITTHNQGKNLFYGDLNKFDWFDQLPKNVDLIVITEVLEHLEAPVKTLRYIRDEKNRDCKVLLSVPNGGSLGRFILSALRVSARYPQDWQHLYVFNEATIKNCCKEAGLEVLELVPYARIKRYRMLRFCPWFASGFFVLCR